MNKYYEKIRQHVNEDIYERIIELEPKNYNEFKAIKGIGEKKLEVIEPVIYEIEKDLLNEGKNNSNAQLLKRLKNLDEKLINVSQNNNMIWNSKESWRNLIDLSKLSKTTLDSIYDLVDNLSSKRSVQLEIPDSLVETRYKQFISSAKTPEDLKDEYAFRKNNWFKSIKNENKKYINEKGKNLLYLAPLFINGKIAINDNLINVRSPFLLFPVEINFNNKKNIWTLNHDSSRDVMINGFVKQYILKNNEVIYDEDLELKTNIENIISKYKNIDFNFENIKTFTKKTSKENSNQKLGEYKITKNIILGLYSGYGNSIQSELSEIIKSKAFTKEFSDFFGNGDILSSETVERINTDVKKNIDNVQDYSYTNNLNYQQLKALNVINHIESNGLTIWGPPGTGKSETIVSIIENAISKNQKVLVVSEKQQALEVIKNRLKLLEDKSILISDDTDKKAFYSQLKKIIDNNIEISWNENKPKLNIKLEEMNLLYNPLLGDKNFDDLTNEIYKNGYYKLNQMSNFDLQKYVDDLINVISREDILEYKNSIEEIIGLDKADDLINVISNIDVHNKDYQSIVDEINSNIKYINDNITRLRNIKNDDKLILDKIVTLKKINILFNKKIKKELFDKYQITKYEIKKIKKSTFFNTLDDEIKNEIILFGEKQKILKVIRNNRILISNLVKLRPEFIELYKNLSLKNFKKDLRESLSYSLPILLDRYFNDEVDKINTYENKIDDLKGMFEAFNLASENDIIQSVNKNTNSAAINGRITNIKQITEKSRPMTIKKFMLEYGIEMNKLVRVWMAQPEVIPVVFDLKDKFDLVIFDEASQIFLERSIPAVLRAKKIVVLGDEKQMGPSNFFAGRVSSEELDDDLIETDESLLKYSKSKLLNVMLQNHYRSEHIDLIKFSNDNYYQGKLNFMNKNNLSYSKSVDYSFVTNGTYVDNVNKKEAKKVIDKILEIYRSGSNDSIGIITANKKQAVLIEDEIFYDYPELEKWLTKNKYFSKSIENVQGDERDVIIFSTTYGPSAKGTQSINFGPINKELGSNRINVAVTRAKKKMIVVSSILLEKALIKTKDSLHQGPRDFINYILLIKEMSSVNNLNKDIVKIGEENIQFDSKLEEEAYKNISKLLIKSKYGIKHKYESYGYQIDIVIYDKTTDKNILAIEFKNKDSKENRNFLNSDFLRKKFLEDRGWKYYRIWHTNWWNDHEYELEKIFNIIKEG